MYRGELPRPESWGIPCPGAAPCCLPRWPQEKRVVGRQLRPHLSPPGIAPLLDEHRWGLEGGQGDVVGRDQLYSDAVCAATVSSGSKPGGGWGLGPHPKTEGSPGVGQAAGLQIGALSFISVLPMRPSFCAPCVPRAGSLCVQCAGPVTPSEKRDNPSGYRLTMSP